MRIEFILSLLCGAIWFGWNNLWRDMYLEWKAERQDKKAKEAEVRRLLEVERKRALMKLAAEAGRSRQR